MSIRSVVLHGRPGPGATVALDVTHGFGIGSAVTPPQAQRGIPPNLGLPVTMRNFSLLALVTQEWGSEFAAPDHRVYEFSNGRGFDSTDLGSTGIYRKR